MEHVHFAFHLSLYGQNLCASCPSHLHMGTKANDPSMGGSKKVATHDDPRHNIPSPLKVWHGAVPINSRQWQSITERPRAKSGVVGVQSRLAPYQVGGQFRVFYAQDPRKVMCATLHQREQHNHLQIRFFVPQMDG